jgi:ribonucleoside-diphosphate reductase beta chain
VTVNDSAIDDLQVTPTGAPDLRLVDTPVQRPNLLDPGFELTLRPMRYPGFYDQFRDAIKNTWTVEEVDLHNDLADLRRLTAAEQHLINRLVAFFATGDTIVSNNLVLNLYQHLNSPEARLYLSRQLFEEAVHVQFYLTLLDTYIPDERERQEAFTAVENIPSIKGKADFCFRWIDSLASLNRLETQDQRRAFLLNLICFAACIEGLFFYGAFAYVYFLRSRGLLNGLASGTNWVFRDESMHMAFAFDVVETVRREEPELFDDNLAGRPPWSRRAGPLAGRHARLPRTRRRPPADPARHRSGLRLEQPVLVHGVAGRAGTVELLRATSVVLSDRRDGSGRLRRRLLMASHRGPTAEEVVSVGIRPWRERRRAVGVH